MREIIDEAAALESTTVGVYRTAATVKGGRRFSFAALVVVGDRNGRLGVGYGKANQVPPAIEKAQKEARRRMRPYPLQGRTIPHAVTGRFGSCMVRLVPASPGTGVIAGAAVRAPLEVLGVQDCLTKSFGSNNPKNLVKAVLAGLDQIRSKGFVAAMRGVELAPTDVEVAIAKGKAYEAVAHGPALVTTAAPARPAPPTKKKTRGGRGRRRPEKPASDKGPQVSVDAGAAKPVDAGAAKPVDAGAAKPADAGAAKPADAGAAKPADAGAAKPADAGAAKPRRQAGGCGRRQAGGCGRRQAAAGRPSS
jgi:small subunit ribosomal protein S5